MYFMLHFKMEEKILKYMGKTVFTANLFFHTRRSCLECDGYISQILQDLTKTGIEH